MDVPALKPRGCTMAEIVDELCYHPATLESGCMEPRITESPPRRNQR